MTWRTSKLGDVCKMYQPKTISTKQMVKDGKYLVFGANGIIGRYNKYNHEKPQLLITCRGATCGAVNISKPKSWINGNAMVIQPKTEDLSLKFIEFFFKGKINLSNIITGAAQPQITRESLNPINISYPSIDKQNLIVNKLDEIFLSTDKTLKSAKTNINNYNILLQNFIVDLFHQDCFEELKLGQVCDVIGGSQPPKSKFQKQKNAENVRLIQIRDYKSDKHIVYIPKNITKKFCTEKDVMIGRYGPPLFQILSGLKGAYNVALMKAVPKLDKIKNDYLFYFLKNKKMQNHIISLSSRAAGQTGVNKETLLSYPIKLPPLNIQEKIIKKVDEIKNLSEKIKYLNQEKIKNLNLLKKSIIKNYLNKKLI